MRWRHGALVAVLVIVPCTGHVEARSSPPIFALRPSSCPGAFGASVAVLDDVIVVGGNGRQADSGRVDVFDAATGAVRFVLTSPDSGNRFGAVVAAGDDTIAVSDEGTCSVHLFDVAGRPRAVLRDLTVPDECFLDRLVIAGGRVAVGISGRGIKLFDAATGSFLADTRGPVADGFSVALSSHTVLAGLPFTGDHDIGRVDRFDVATGAFLHTLYAPRRRVGAGPFGTALAVDGSRLAVGTWHDRRWRDCVGLFDVRSSQLRKVLCSPRRRSGFGAAIAVRGDRMLVGAPEVGKDAGRAYLFSTSTGRRLASYRAGMPFDRAGAGLAVALGHGIAVVGAPGGDGAVAVFRAPVE